MTNLFDDLPQEKKDVLQHLAAGSNIFITGCAGTGKSFLLKLIKEVYDPYGLAVTASTGIAAVQIGAVTLHSWAGIGMGDQPVEKIFQHLDSFKGAKQRNQMRAAKMLAIDEISMVSAEIFELLDQVLRYVRRNNSPFGGIQLILLGDFLQLPPISREGNSRFCFETDVWQQLDIKTCMLKQVFRQQEQKFVSLLNNMRFGKVTPEDIEMLKSRMNLDYSQLQIRPTIITTHNSLAEQANIAELNAINAKVVSFTQETGGQDNRVEFLQKYCLAPIRLDLKVGAQVMMIRNQYIKHGVSNGSIGVVRGFSMKGWPEVEFENNVVLKIQPSTWEYIEMDPKTLQPDTKAYIRQLPLIYAWSITVHKSQGMSIDSILCDLGRLFEHGQGYVALSRAKSLSGLYMKSFDFSRVRFSQKAVEFYSKLGQ